MNPPAKPFKRLYQLALAYLAKREYARKELVEKLHKKSDKFPEFTAESFSAEIDQVIKILQEKNLLNDQRFTEIYTRMRAQRGYGPLRIQTELKQRGIIIDNNKNTLFNSELNSDLMNIQQIREKKFGATLPHHSDLKEQAKQARYLSYKGFSFEDIKKVLKSEQ